jgi:glycine/D-amino acid oxidase-like deaminating enzyme
MNEYRSLSLWHDTLGASLDPRPSLTAGDAARSWDVAIMGAGYTGLWTALALKKQRPDLSVIVIEKEIAGFGASGRNGGWCSALFPTSTNTLLETHGLVAAKELRTAMVDAVSSVGRWAKDLDIDCDFVAGGTMMLARNDIQVSRGTTTLAENARVGVDRLEWLEPDQTLGATRVQGAVFDPGCARLHPAKLVRGLARSAEEAGVRIVEKTAVTRFGTGFVETTHGRLLADCVVNALEGYASQLAQTRRSTLPLYSLMIATEPLPESFFDEVRLEHGMTFADYRSLVIYGQRTADNRIAFGGRGAPYHWGSGVSADYENVPKVFQALWETLTDMFPRLTDHRVTHSWGGVLGVPRDWHASVTLDEKTRVARAGGYVGDGVGLSHLAGLTLADLILGAQTPRTTLAFVGHNSRNWEPEPLRYLGATAAILGVGLADRIEATTGKPALVSRVIAPLTGH